MENQSHFDIWELNQEPDSSQEAPWTNSNILNSLSENLKSISQAIKSTEELERLLVKENVSEIDRALFLLSPDRQPVQKLSVINNLQNLLKEYREDTIQRVIPKLLQLVSPNSKRELETSIAAGIALAAVIRETQFSTEQLTEVLLPKILHTLSGKEPELLYSWIETLLSIIEVLPIPTLLGSVVPFAKAKGSLSESVSSRIDCCKILGKVATRLESDVIEASFLQQTLVMCQDISYEVRSCMSEQLSTLARGIGVKLAKKLVLPELIELLRDEQLKVRESALDCFVSLMDFFDKETRTDTLIPFMKTFCRSAPPENYPMIARMYGKLLVHMYSDSDDEIVEFLVLFQTLTKFPSGKIRASCAFNFPAVIQVAGDKKFFQYFHVSYRQLAGDVDPNVRRTLASGFHEAALLLKENLKYIRDLLVLFLKDPFMEVRAKIISKLDIIIPLFRESEDPMGIYASLISPLLDAYASLTNWRLQVQFVQTIGSFDAFFTSTQICDKFVPLLFKIMANGFLPVKEAASLSLCLLLRTGVRSAAKRKEINAKLISDFAKGKSYWHRMTFISTMQSLLKVFSRKYFKESFIDVVLEMTQDPVPNVRGKLCSLFPHMKKMMKLPFDGTILKKVVNSLNTLKTDKSLTVAKAAGEYADQFAMIEPSGGGSGAEDFIDKKKEQEEEEMSKNEEKEADEAKKKEEEARNELRRKIAEKEHEITMKAKIFGKRPKAQLMTLPVGEGDKIAKGKPKSLIRDSSKESLTKSPKKTIEMPPLIVHSITKKPGSPVSPNGATSIPKLVKVPSATSNSPKKTATANPKRKTTT